MEELYEEDLLELSLDFDTLFDNEKTDLICNTLLKKNNVLKSLIKLFRDKEKFNNLDTIFQVYVSEFAKPSPIDRLVIVYDDLKILMYKKSIHLIPSI